MTSLTAARTASLPPRAMIALFTLTIFTSALLLFFVQPLYTRMVLPQIGGAAAVWTTAMLFFQTVLIGGYLYAHLLTRHLPISAQIGVHVVMMIAAVLALPLGLPGGFVYDAARPVVLQTLWLYALGVGLPFAVLSANAPLLQSWYRHSGGPRAHDPYFLYAASNLGSLTALLGFPLVAEPLFGMSSTAVGWSIGFVALGPMLLLSGLAAWRASGAVPQGAGVPVPVLAEVGAEGDAAGPGPAKLAYWAFLAFLPSSLMLAITTKISTDMGSFPLVWVVPLALYLLTFVLVFSTSSAFTAPRLRLALPVALAILIYFSLRPAGQVTGFALLILGFFVIGLLAHRLMFDSRPTARHLTVFYLTMSIGGALGGLFNSILAPMMFDRMIELAVTVALTAFLALTHPVARPVRDLGLGFFLGIAALLTALLPLAELPGNPNDVRAMLIVAVLVGSLLWLRQMRLAAVLAVVTVLGVKTAVISPMLVYQDRSFFGQHDVFDREVMRTYNNGTTMHGAQLRGETGRPTPLLYYHRDGLLAQIFNGARGEAARTVGIIGLGLGSLSCYARPGQDWHFYEIDQKVVDIAFNPELFTFMTACGQAAKVHLGDARIVLQGQTDLRYDLLLMDAYSSDALPLHLITVEATELYLARLNPDGLLIIHISNRFYDLSLPLASLADRLGLEARIAHRTADEIAKDGTDVVSRVVVMARTVEALGSLATDPRWQPLPAPQLDPWTDDNANILSALRHW